MGRLPSGMRDFQRMILHCNFTGMGYLGLLFTWCNKRGEGVIFKKLDRVLMNDTALQRSSSAYSVFEPQGSLIYHGFHPLLAMVYRCFKIYLLRYRVYLECLQVQVRSGEIW